jgi:hypothetical protein
MVPDRICIVQVCVVQVFIVQAVVKDRVIQGFEQGSDGQGIDEDNRVEGAICR